jgi:hypothetical protein
MGTPGFVNEYKPPIPPDLEHIMNPPSTPESRAAARRMTGEEKLRIAFDLSKQFVARIKADILAAHPDWTPVQRHRAFLDYMLGPDAPPPDFDLSQLPGLQD